MTSNGAARGAAGWRPGGAETGGWRNLPAAIGDEELVRWRPSLTLPIAVTGATGFVGSHLVAALVAMGVRPRVLVRDPGRLHDEVSGMVEPVIGDLDATAALARLVTGAGTVIHVAGLVRAPREAHFDRVNRLGTANLLAALAVYAPAARLVHVSSLAAAGPSRDPAGVRSGDPALPVSAYGRSKRAGELEALRHLGPVVILRPPAVFGPRDIDVLQFFRLTAAGWVPLPSGRRYVTLAYVSDVVRAVLAAAAGRGTGLILNLGDPEPQAMTDLIRAIGRAGGYKVRVIPLPGPVVRSLGAVGDVLHLLGFRSVALTSDKASELLAHHWAASTRESLQALGLDGCVPFADAAAATWNWYRAQGWVPHAKIRRL